MLAAPAAAEVTVRVLPGTPGATPSVELTARSAPLSEVLDRLSRQIGMKVVYEGASPRQLVTVSLQGRSPAETVLGLLEGTGVNFALLADPSGSRVETLLVAGSAPQAASASSSTPSAAASVAGRSSSSFRRPVAPPGPGPDALEEDPEDLAEDEDLDEPAMAGAPEGAPQPAGVGATGAEADPNAPVQGAPQPPPQGFAPTSSFPVSPFAPQAPTPYMPQPYAPVPPGVAGAPTNAPAQQQQQPPRETTGQPPPD
jgi:hypothetical protein